MIVPSYQAAVVAARAAGTPPPADEPVWRRHKREGVLAAVDLGVLPYPETVSIDDAPLPDDAEYEAVRLAADTERLACPWLTQAVLTRLYDALLAEGVPPEQMPQPTWGRRGKFIGIGHIAIGAPSLRIRVDNDEVSAQSLAGGMNPRVGLWAITRPAVAIREPQRCARLLLALGREAEGWNPAEDDHDYDRRDMLARAFPAASVDIVGDLTSGLVRFTAEQPGLKVRVAYERGDIAGSFDAGEGVEFTGIYGTQFGAACASLARIYAQMEGGGR